MATGRGDAAGADVGGGPVAGHRVPGRLGQGRPAARASARAGPSSRPGHRRQGALVHSPASSRAWASQVAAARSSSPVPEAIDREALGVAEQGAGHVLGQPQVAGRGGESSGQPGQLHGPVQRVRAGAGDGLQPVHVAAGPLLGHQRRGPGVGPGEGAGLAAPVAVEGDHRVPGAGGHVLDAVQLGPGQLVQALAEAATTSSGSSSALPRR